MRSKMIAMAEAGEKADISGLVEASMFLYNENGSPLFADVETGVATLKAMPLEQSRALVRAVKLGTVNGSIPEDEVIARAKNSEAAA